MKNYFEKISYLLNEKLKIRFYILLLLTVITSLLEYLSLAALFPSIVLITNNKTNVIDNNIFIIARDLKRYQQIKDGLDYFVNNDVLFYPQWDCVPYDRISPNKLITY